MTSKCSQHFQSLSKTCFDTFSCKMLCVVATWFNQFRSSTSHPGCNQVDGLPPAPVRVLGSWLRGVAWNYLFKKKVDWIFEQISNIRLICRCCRILGFQKCYSYMASNLKCYHLVARTAAEQFFAKDEIEVFLLFQFWRCFYHYIATTTGLTTVSKFLLFISGSVCEYYNLAAINFKK